MTNLSFQNFLFDDKILSVLENIGYKEPTSIQAMAIPKILDGLDVIASAQTGTGKTAAFLLPILHKFTEPFERVSRGPRLVVLVPTRELAMQVAAEAKKYSAKLPNIKIACIYGGVPYDVQKRSLSKNLDILVATPGRLIDLMEQDRVDLSQVEFFVLDEADRMLDMGFIGPVEEIAADMPPERQTLLFSATLDKKIMHLSKKLQNDPAEIRFEVDQATSTQIEQKLYHVDGIRHKMKLLDHLLENTEIEQAIVFTATKRKADEIADHIQEKGYSAGALHGDMNQRQRTRTLGRLRDGNIQFLVATDVAARGIDIATITHVINFDLPTQTEDFIHRIGRTGRAGATGIAISFATRQENYLVKEIGKLMKTPMTYQTIEGMEPQERNHDEGSQDGRRRNKRTFGDKPKRDERRSSFDRKPRSNDENRSFDRKPRSNDENRSFNREDRPRKPFNREEKSFNREDRPRKPFNREEKSFNREERSFNREDRPRKPFNREERSFNREDRPRKPFNREEKSSNREERPFPKKSFDRGEKSFNREDRPRKSFNREEKSFSRDGKPKRSEFKPWDRTTSRNKSSSKPRVYKTLSQKTV